MQRHSKEDSMEKQPSNRAENQICPFTVGRKNWLFSDTPAGAKASAVIYSIVETAKANNLAPEIISRFPHSAITKFPRAALLRSING